MKKANTRELKETCRRERRRRKRTKKKYKQSGKKVQVSERHTHTGAGIYRIKSGVKRAPIFIVIFYKRSICKIFVRCIFATTMAQEFEEVFFFFFFFFTFHPDFVLNNYLVFIFFKGQWIWLPDENDVFVPSKVLIPFCQGAVGQVERMDGQQVEVPENISKNCIILDAQSLESIDDMATLNNLDEPSLLHNLRLRFMQGDIYTNVASILVSVNPFQELSIYKTEILNNYLTDGSHLPPHIYSIGGVHF
jgi:hypothetical protein